MGVVFFFWFFFPLTTRNVGAVGFVDPTVGVCDNAGNGSVVVGPPANNDWKGPGWSVSHVVPVV